MRAAVERKRPGSQSDGAQRSAWPARVVAAAVLVGVVLALYPSRIDPGDRFRAAQSWSTSAGAAELHWFDEVAPGFHEHVVFLDAKWTDTAAIELFAADPTAEWRQVLTVGDAAVRSYQISSWSTDLPAAYLSHRQEADGRVVLTVGTHAPGELETDRTYRTQIVVRAGHILDGLPWSYQEDVGPASGLAYASSRPVSGRVGVCDTCMRRWLR